MNFGTDDIESVIWNQIRMGVTVQCKGGTKKFVKDLAKQIYSYLELNMNQDMKTMARARGITEAELKATERIAKAFSFDAMNLTPKDIEVYTWVIEQETKGQTIEAFVKWAKMQEGGKFIRMYRKDSSNIKIDWDRAFNVQKYDGPNADIGI